MNISLQRIVNIIVVILLLTSCNPPASTGLKVAAWYIADSTDIPLLEKKGFNLFFIGEDFSQQTPADQDANIQKYIDALEPGSQMVLSIQPWLQYNWFTGEIDQNGCQDRKENSQVSTGLEEFINRWGGSDPQYPKRDQIYGFLLADDVQLTPFGEGCVAQPKNALWVVRWFYQMIRNTAEDRSQDQNARQRKWVGQARGIVAPKFGTINAKINAPVNARATPGRYTGKHDNTKTLISAAAAPSRSMADQQVCGEGCV
jgi:hypothetical protein